MLEVENMLITLILSLDKLYMYSKYHIGPKDLYNDDVSIKNKMKF
jgi:hypothetical protein